MSTDPKSPSAPDDQAELLRRWIADLSQHLLSGGASISGYNAEASKVDLTQHIDAILALAGTAAHAVVRPAAPLTTFVAGFASGLAAGSGVAAGTADAGGAGDAPSGA